MPQTTQQHSKPQLEHVSPDTLRPHPDNPRIHTRKQIKQVANSIKAFGFQGVVLADEDSQLIAGHARVEACKLLGVTEVPLLRVKNLTDEQVRGLMIADNRLTDNSDWDDRLLGHNLKILADLELDFDLDAVGFDYGELEFRIGQIELTNDDEQCAEDNESSLPDFDQVQAVSKPGDLWCLGDHRLICNDSTLAETYEQLLGNERAAMIFTDPPYNLPARDIGKICAEAHRDFAMGFGEMTPEEFTAFLGSVINKLCQYSVPGSIHYIFMDWRHAAEILTAGQTHYSEFKNLCVWSKDRAGMGTFYRSQHELVFVFKHGDAPHQNHFELGQHGRTRSNVWHYPSARSMTSGDGDFDRDEVLEHHPTVKPVKLIEEIALDCSRRGEIVLDPFLGSGSTLIACEKTQRRCFGIELEPRYVDVAIQRWQQWTEQEAIHEATGQTYNQIATQRGEAMSKEPTDA